MNLLKIDINELKPNIIDAYVYVFGEKYRKIIKERVEKVEFIHYINLDGIEEYYKDAIAKLEFKYLRNSKGVRINPLPEKNKTEFLKGLDEIEKYKNYAEKKRMEMDNVSKHFTERVSKVWPKDPYETVDEYNKSKTDRILKNFRYGLDVKSDIEYFSSDDEQKIKESGYDSEDVKYDTLYYRKKYLLDTSYFEDMSPKYLSDYLYMNASKFYEFCCEDEGIKMFIPDAKTVDFISVERKKACNKIKVIQLCGEEKLFEKIKKDYPEAYEKIIEYMKKRYICYIDLHRNSKARPIIVFTVRPGELGLLDYALLHEMCHNIEGNEVFNNGKKIERKCGFNSHNNYDEKNKANPYNKKYGLFERFNETITDIFAIEARQYLNAKGIYMIESEIFENRNISNYNTSKTLKDIIKPFLDRYREYIIEARISGNMERLFNVVGKDNFYRLNDIVNKVDSMKNYSECLEENFESYDEIEIYNKQLQKLKQIYRDMENNIQLAGNNKREYKKTEVDGR